MSNTVINTNALSVNACGNAKKAGGNLSKAAEKLSSGLRINSAADDAAGLAVSEKMRSQIRGLTYALKNAQDGASLIQTADGGMSEIHSILRRQRELVVLSLNDTNTEGDRAKIQLEIEQTLDEISHIAYYTEFNKIKILAGGGEAPRGAGSAGGGGGVPGASLPGAAYYIDLGNVLGAANYSQVVKLSDSLTLGANWETTGKPYAYYARSVPPSSTVPAHFPPDMATLAELNAFVVSQLAELGVTNTSYGALSALTNTGYWTFSSALVGQRQTIVITHRSIYGMTDAQYQIGYESDTLSAQSQIARLYAAGYSYENGVNQQIWQVSYTSSPEPNAPGSPGQGGAADLSYGCAWLDFSGFGVDYDASHLHLLGFNSTCATCEKHYSIQFVNGGGNRYVDSASNPALQVDISGAASGKDIVDLIMSAVKTAREFNNHYTQYAVDPSQDSKIFLYDNRTAYNAFSSNPGGGSVFELYARAANGEPILKEAELSAEPVETPETEPNALLWIQSGANSCEGALINLYDCRVETLGVKNINVLTRGEANYALYAIDAAASAVSGYRATAGAQQNRLEHTMNHLGAAADACAVSESRIRDADMAKELLNSVKAKVLLEAGTVMLAQANAAPQAVLTLLKQRGPY